MIKSQMKEWLKVLNEAFVWLITPRQNFVDGWYTCGKQCRIRPGMLVSAKRDLTDGTLSVAEGEVVYVTAIDVSRARVRLEIDDDSLTLSVRPCDVAVMC